MWISCCHWQNYLSYYRSSRVWQVSYHIHLAALSPSYWTYYVDKDDVTCVRYVRYETNVRIYSYWGAIVNKELSCWVGPVGGARALNNEMRFISDCIGCWNALVIVIFCSIRTLYSSNVSFTKTTLCVRTKSMESFHRFVEDLAHNLRYVRYPRKNITNENS